MMRRYLLGVTIDRAGALRQLAEWHGHEVAGCVACGCPYLTHHDAGPYGVLCVHCAPELPSPCGQDGALTVEWAEHP